MLSRLVRAIVLLVALSSVVGAFPASAAVATYPEPVEGDFVLRDFRFATGETLPKLKLHYRTLGRAVRAHPHQ